MVERLAFNQVDVGSIPSGVNMHNFSLVKSSTMVTKHVRVGNSSKDARFHQRSPLWKRVRRCMMTGSSAGVLVNRGCKDTVTKKSLTATYTDGAVKEITGIGKLNCDYGTHMEETAIVDYTHVVAHHTRMSYPEYHVEVKVNDVSFYVESEAKLMASPDGEVDITLTPKDESSGLTPLSFKGVLEVKCPAGSYFGKRAWAKTDRPISFRMFPDLLPGAQKTTRKYGPPKFEAPLFSLREPITFEETDKARFYRQSDTLGFGAKGAYSQYYFQCVANLMLSGREFIDFFVWTDPVTVNGKGHRFFYKKQGEIFPSFHMERLYASDPQVQADYDILIKACEQWSYDYQRTLRANILAFLEEMLGPLE